MHRKEKNYYEILEISPDASAQEVYQGYTRVKNAYSLDSLALYSIMSKEECLEMSEQVEEAYNIISDPDKRDQYNKARGIKSNFGPQKIGSGGQFDTPIGPAQNIDQALNQQYENNNNNLATNYPQSINEVPIKKDMAKIVAQQQYRLEYVVNADLEQEIEECTQFTGEFLKKIREYKNVDINRMAEMTKVSKTYLRKIENEDTSNLPALVYVRGFVYQYAKCLKLNPEIVASSYLFRLKQTAGAA